jgi:hypothetical protein
MTNFYIYSTRRRKWLGVYLQRKNNHLLRLWIITQVLIAEPTAACILNKKTSYSIKPITNLNYLTLTLTNKKKKRPTRFFFFTPPFTPPSSVFFISPNLCRGGRRVDYFLRFLAGRMILFRWGSIPSISLTIVLQIVIMAGNASGLGSTSS